MAVDNVVLNAGSGGSTVRTFSDGTNEWQGVVVSYVTGGSAGSWTLQQVDGTHGLPVNVLNASIAVTGTFWQATQPVSGTVTANAGTGTFAVSAASLPLPTGAATAAKQPALGTAGSASTDVLSVQGIASMTALKVDGSAVTQPVSGTVTANIGTGNLAGITGNVTVVGAAASGAAKSGNPVQTGAVFNTTQPTVATGQMVEAQATARGARIVATGVDTFHVTIDNATVAVTQSGSWSLAAHQSTNVDQWNGTTVDTNSGVKSAGTLRVVLATDQPQLTNKLLVTADAITFASAQPVTQSGAWTVATNADAGLGAGTAPSKALIIGGQHNTAAPTLTNGQTAALQTDSSGNLLVSIAAGGGSGGTASSFGSAFPATGTAIGFKDSTGTNMAAGNLDASGFLKVNVAAGSAGNGAASNTASAVPTQADYAGLNVGGTLRGQTGVNPSGSVFAAQVDLASVAGATVATGHGTASGAIRVELPTDGTGLVNAAQSGTWTVATNGDGSASGGTAGTKSILAGGVFNTSAPTLTNGQQVALQTDNHGNIKTFSMGGAGPNGAVPVEIIATNNTVIGTAASTTGPSTAAWTSATTINTALIMGVGNFPTVAVSFFESDSGSATLSGGILTFEADDGTGQWYPISGVRSGSFTQDGTYTVTGGKQLWQFDVAGFSNFRVRLSTVLSQGAGTGTATGNVSVRAVAASTDQSLVVGQPTAANLQTTATQGGSWTVTANAGTGTFAISAASLPLPSGAATSAKQPALGTAGTASSDVLTVQGIASMTALKVDGSGVTQPVSGTVTVNAGTNLNTSALALDTSVNGLLVSQGSTTSGEKGPLVQGAVTTAAPSYTTAQTSPLSLTTGGALRVDASAGGTVTVTASNLQANVNQVGGNAIATGNGTTSTGTQRVTISSDSTGQVALAAGTATVGSVKITDGTNVPAVDANASSNALAVAVKPSSSGGWSKTKFTAQTTTVQTVKGSAGILAGWFILNPNASAIYVQLFDTAGAVTLGTTAPDMILPISASAAANLLSDTGINFANGIKLAVTTTATGSTAPGTGADMSIFFK